MRTTNHNSIGFAQDNFAQRRAAQTGAGVAYDAESLLTGAEVESGLGYGDPRQDHLGAVSTSVRAGRLPIHFLAFNAEQVAQAVARGEVSADLVPAIMPRLKLAS